MTPAAFAEVMRLHNEGLSIRAIRDRTGHGRSAIGCAIANQKAPKRRPTRHGSILDHYQGFLLGKLQQYPELSAARLHGMLKEQGFTGGYSLVKSAVAQLRPTQKPVYESLIFAPGECAQVDWGVWKNFPVPGGFRRVSVFAMVLGHSRLMYAEIFPGESTEFWLEGHRRAFEFFGGVPAYVMVDNCKTAVVKTKRGSQDAVINADFAAFAGHYGFKVHACTPRRPNEKGRIEKGVGYLKGAFLAGREPQPPEVLNPALRDFLLKTGNVRIHGTTGQRPAEHFAEAEKAALRPLPPLPHACAAIVGCVANSCCRVTVDVNQYSVPPAFGSRRLVVHRHVDRIVIRTGEGTFVADHLRHPGRKQQIVNPEHVTALRELNCHARENRLIATFLAIGGQAHEFLIALRDKRIDYRNHLRRINDLTVSHGSQAVAAALAKARECHAYSADAVLNLLEARSRLCDHEQAPIHLLRNAELLQMQTPQVNLEKYERNPTP